MADEKPIAGSAEGSNTPKAAPAPPPPAPEGEARPIREGASTSSASTTSDNIAPGERQDSNDFSNGARIIEETIVRPAPDAKTSSVNAPPLAAVKLPEPSLPPPLPRDIAPPPPPPLSRDASPVSPPKLSPESLPPSTPPSAPPLVSSPSPVAQPTMPSHTSEEFAKEQQAIAKILKEAKLPERREQSGAPQKGGIVFDTTLGATPPLQQAESKPPNVVGPTATPPALETAPVKQGGSLADSIVSPLRTLKNDLQKVVRLKKMSLVRAVALESEKRHGAESEEREVLQTIRSRRTFGVLFAAALLLLLSAAAFFGVFLIMSERSGTSIESPQSSILFAESGVLLPLTGTGIDIKRLLANARLSGSGTLGSITRIIPTITEPSEDGTPIERSATLEEFLSALQTRVPEELVRALSDDFFFGIHTVDKNAPLFVIPVVSYERAFAGMLRWEDTINADLAPAFTAVPDQMIGAEGLPEKRRFEDVVMRNYDVRVLKDDAGMIELYYSFPTRELLIIAESPYSFTEILSRLRAERKL